MSSSNETKRDDATATVAPSAPNEGKIEIVIAAGAAGSSLPNHQQLPMNSVSPSSRNEEEKRRRHLKLYRAALNGDWDIAEAIYREHEDDIPARISKEEDTALHIAAAAKRTNFVKQMVNKMKTEHLSMTNVFGNTPLCLAAASGKVELAKVMVDKNRKLAEIRGSKKMLPLHMAALLGHKEMVLYLYPVTGDVINDKDRIELLVILINTDLYDIALDLLKKHKELAIARDRSGETALHALARKPLTYFNFANHSNLGTLKTLFNLSTNKKMHPLALELAKCLWDQVILLSDSEISQLIGRPWRLLFVAAEQGKFEFLTILIHEYPDLVFKVDESTYSIFHVAVRNRHEDIFKLIYEIGSIKDLVLASSDEEKNNILHLAGMVAPSNRLNIVSGAALQLQRELIWFKEVNKVVQPMYAEAKNKQGKTPRELFTENHKELMEKGEKWMKDTATSCMIVATLIATVVFAAAFTVPGGNHEGTGVPTFLQKVSFKIFALSDAISLISSSCSILMFLSILTSRYSEEDFLLLLPTKLVVGLATLFLSIIAMMVVFCATYFIVFKDGVLKIAIFVTLMASAPVFLFIWQQYHLFFDVVRSTFISSSLFKPSKRALFYKEEGNACECKKGK